MLRYPQRSQFCINSHMNAARGHMDEPGPGLAGRAPFTDLKSPLPDVRLAGGRDAVFHASVDHDGSRVGEMAQGEVFAAAINPGNYGEGAFYMKPKHITQSALASISPVPGLQIGPAVSPVQVARCRSVSSIRACSP